MQSAQPAGTEQCVDVVGQWHGQGLHNNGPGERFGGEHSDRDGDVCGAGDTETITIMAARR